jgi:hypothetical protein
MALPERIECLIAEAKSPYTRAYGMTQTQFTGWLNGLVKLGLKTELDSAIPYWNLLAGIYVITVEEGEFITATEAYSLVGQSQRSGQRYLNPAEDAGLVVLTPVKGNKKQKHVTLAPPAAKLVKETFDRWATQYAPLSEAVLNYHRHEGA